MTKKPLVNGIIKEIGFENYISDNDELKEIRENCEKVIKAQEENTPKKSEQIRNTLGFIQSIWKKYDCSEIAEMYAKFQRIEEALFGLERDERTGGRYRDHFVHMFNCYVFGLRILTSIVNKTNDNDSKIIFKVDDEQLREVGLPFGENYSYKKRLFYLWTLISTFHDIAIPFQHLKNIGSGINKFVQEFGWIFTNPQVSIRSYDSSQLHYYFDLLGKLFGGGLQLIENGKKYKKQDKPHYYISKILGREFDYANHGVLSGFFMWKMIEEIFLVSRTSKYKFNIDQFNAYSEYVLEQDIARAALAISLHNLKNDGRTGFCPRVFPIEFSKMPLTFLLILSDELQEYLRWEGVTIENKMRFCSHPSIETEVKKKKGGFTIQLKVTLSWDLKDLSDIISHAKAICKHRNENSSVDDITKAADVIGNEIKDNLEKKLFLGEGFELIIEILENWKRQIYSKQLKTPVKIEGEK